MKLLLKIILVFLFSFLLTENSSLTTSASNSENELLTGFETLELSKIIDYRILRGLDSITDFYARQKGFSGNVLVAIDGLNVFEKSLNYADPLRKTPLNSSNVFQLASVSKQFTAAAILLLKADGRLDLDDELVKFIPELPYKGITIRHLLHHTGGLPNYFYLIDKYWKSAQHPDNEDIIDLMARYKLPAFFKPGLKYDYSNTGYVMLASVVERVSGLPFSEFLQRRIFSPLGMKQTYVYSTAESNSGRQHLDGFRALKNSYVRINATKNNGPVGDKGVCSTVGDLFIWDQALYSGSPVPAVLLEESFMPAKAANGTEIPYGFGFRLKTVNNQEVVYHNGVWEGFRTNFYRYPASGNTIIILNNTSTRVNHEMVTDFETLFNNQPKADYTKMLVNILIEEGLPAAAEAFTELKSQYKEATINLRSIVQVADFLEQSGKPSLASQFYTMVSLMTEKSDI
ncbi:MAG: beta-lactamase family protein [Lentimicrobium sp.]|nr:beta-lactamase family protein [Lentimicrobium sp.]